MKEVKSVLKELGVKNGLEMDLDENGACTFELADGRVMLIQERADLGELDFVATLGPVPEEVRADVFGHYFTEYESFYIGVGMTFVL